jgi:Ca2+-binding EF-hand superfamily protein
MKQLGILDDTDTQALFKFLDKNGDGKIGYSEFLESFSAMNTQAYIN